MFWYFLGNFKVLVYFEKFGTFFNPLYGTFFLNHFEIVLKSHKKVAIGYLVKKETIV